MKSITEDDPSSAAEDDSKSSEDVPRADASAREAVPVFPYLRGGDGSVRHDLGVISVELKRMLRVIVLMSQSSATCHMSHPQENFGDFVRSHLQYKQCYANFKSRAELAMTLQEILCADPDMRSCKIADDINGRNRDVCADVLNDIQELRRRGPTVIFSERCASAIPSNLEARMQGAEDMVTKNSKDIALVYTTSQFAPSLHMAAAAVATGNDDIIT